MYCVFHKQIRKVYDFCKFSGTYARIGKIFTRNIGIQLRVNFTILKKQGAFFQF